MRRTSQVRRKWIDFDMIIERVHKGLGEGLFHQIHLFNFAFLPDAQLVRCPNLRRTSEVRRRWVNKRVFGSDVTFWRANNAFALCGNFISSSSSF